MHTMFPKPGFAKTCRGLAGLAAAAVITLCSGAVQAAQTLGPVTDPIGVVRVPKGAPIQIGGMWVISGPDTALGVDEQRAAQIAFQDVGGKVMGHPLKLDTEDDQCNSEGGQTAATKLASNPQIFVVLGPACSSVATPGAPNQWQQGIVDIGNASTAPALTAADRKPAYDGFVRTVFSDNEQGKADATYLFKVAKARTVVTIHDGSPYAQQLQQVMANNFTAMGGKVLSQEAVSPTDVDMHPVLTRIASE